MRKFFTNAAILTSAAILATSCSGGSGSGGGYKTGFGIVTHIGSSASATAEAAGKGQVDSYIAVITLDASGKITKCQLDVAQTAVNFDATGVVTSDLAEPVKSKLEKKDEYGMKQASAIGKEWYEQATALAEWCVGKTVDEVKGLKIKAVNEEHTTVPDIPELTSSVTIAVGDWLLAVEKAAANAQ
ncbi:MAG: hypothetical protein LBS84_00910 [Clostridiales bacterium]|jgi:hypothetical protein|nr:hypothetical protein [Clostridiales bacterium]